jgi:hypothetical protein
MATAKQDVRPGGSTSSVDRNCLTGRRRIVDYIAEDSRAIRLRSYESVLDRARSSA